MGRDKSKMTSMKVVLLSLVTCLLLFLDVSGKPSPKNYLAEIKDKNHDDYNTEMGSWSQWSEFKFDRPYACSDDGEMIGFTRTRKCKASKESARATCQGEDSQTNSIPLPPCDPFKQYQL